MPEWSKQWTLFRGYKKFTLGASGPLIDPGVAGKVLVVSKQEAEQRIDQARKAEFERLREGLLGDAAFAEGVHRLNQWPARDLPAETAPAFRQALEAALDKLGQEVGDAS